MVKSCTNDLWPLDVRKLAREGGLVSGSDFCVQWSSRGSQRAQINLQVHADSVTLDYRHKSNGGDWQSKNYSVLLTHTRCNLGGERVWWSCPVDGCGKRVAVLYLGSSGIFACRHCYRLVYRSQQETPLNRAFRRADNLRARLGWLVGIAHPVGGKPKGMHWRTYEFLKAKYYMNLNQVLGGSMEKMGFMRGHMGQNRPD